MLASLLDEDCQVNRQWNHSLELSPERNSSRNHIQTHVTNKTWSSGVLEYSAMHATGHIPEAQCAFKILMIHEVLQFALRIAFRCVLHRCGSLDIRCWKLYNIWMYLWGGELRSQPPYCYSSHSLFRQRQPLDLQLYIVCKCVWYWVGPSRFHPCGLLGLGPGLVS